MAVYLGWRVTSVQAIVLDIANPVATVEEPRDIKVSLPEFSEVSELAGILPEIDPHTTIPTRPRDEVIDYTVDTGDSVFGIASAYGLKPETILWANYDTLNDNPDQISIGMQLKVPPEDGVLYLWQDGDTLQGVADRFEAKVEDILSWAGNQLDLTDPQVEPGTYVMVPGGHREFRQWIVPTIPRGRAGVSSSLYGAGTCEGGYDGAYGSGTFIWPADNHTLSGNDYWSGHLAIDIAAGGGDFATDSGVIVFAGPAYGGMGI
jgi:LysM repeat protein